MHPRSTRIGFGVLAGPPLFLVAVALLGMSCGSSGGGDPEPSTLTLSIGATEDGFFEQWRLTVQPNDAMGIAVGSWNGQYLDGYVRFPHPPALVSAVTGGRLVRVVLTVSKSEFTGNPQLDHPVVSHRHVDFGPGPLDFATDFDKPAVPGTATGVVSTWINAGDQVLAIDVTAHVTADITAGRTSSDYYFWSVTSSAPQSFWRLQDSEGRLATGSTPRLDIEYRP